MRLLRGDEMSQDCGESVRPPVPHRHQQQKHAGGTPLKRFERDFRDAISASIDAQGSIVISGIAFSPVEILEDDPDSYREAYLDWLANDWVPIRDERLNLILSDKANAQRFGELLIGTKAGRVVPFLGSGMSAPCGMPLWSSFLQDLQANSTLTAEKLEDLLRAGEYEAAATALAAAMPPHLFDERIEQTLCIPAGGEIMGSVRLLPAVFDETAITSNLDDVLEVLQRIEGAPFDEVLSGTAIAQFRFLRGKGRRCLLKVHGDRANRAGRVLTTAEYDAAYGPGCAARDELEYVFGTEPLLFMGCSLEADRTMRLLKEVVDGDDNTPRNYAFMRRPGDEQTRLTREHFLAERKIFPIWYDGDHDESIEALLFGLARAKGKI